MLHLLASTVPLLLYKQEAAHGLAAIYLADVASLCISSVLCQLAAIWGLALSKSLDVGHY